MEILNGKRDRRDKTSAITIAIAGKTKLANKI
jgi:hypothetical protein